MSKTIEELMAESKALGFEPPEEHRGVAMQEMQTSFRIVETDNYGSDYPDEKFLNIPALSSKEKANEIADVINKHCCDRRYWRVVPHDYKLRPGFEP